VYNIVLKKTNMPNYQLEKIGEFITIEIFEIDKNEMKYAATFKGHKTMGQMMKSN
jgi:hypothetical protein